MRTEAEIAWDLEMAYANFDGVSYPEAAKRALAAWDRLYKPGEVATWLELSR